MNLCVLSGSPKGNESVTIQYVRFLELANPGHTFTTENIGQRIAAIEAHEEEFKKNHRCNRIRGCHPLRNAGLLPARPRPVQAVHRAALLLQCRRSVPRKYADGCRTMNTFFTQLNTLCIHAGSADLFKDPGQAPHALPAQPGERVLYPRDRPHDKREHQRSAPGARQPRIIRPHCGPEEGKPAVLFSQYRSFPLYRSPEDRAEDRRNPQNSQRISCR